MAPASAFLTVDRNSPEDSQDRELYVSLDGHDSHILRYGDSLTLPIDAGPHDLRVHNTWSRKRAAFDAAPGEHVRFVAVNLAPKKVGVLAGLLGFAAMETRLTREDPGSDPPTPGA